MAKKDETFIASLHTKKNIERKVNSAFLKGALLFCFLLNIALCITIVIIARLPKTEIPYVIEITKDGNASIIKDAAVTFSKWEPSKTTVMHTLKNYIIWLRSIPRDSLVIKENIKKVYAYSSDRATDYVTSYFSSASPIAESENIFRRVSVYSAIPVIDKSDIYQVDWNEKDYSHSGTLKNERNYRGMFKIKRYKSENTGQQEQNPLGLYISDIEITSIQNGGSSYEE